MICPYCETTQRRRKNVGKVEPGAGECPGCGGLVYTLRVRKGRKHETRWYTSDQRGRSIAFLRQYEEHVARRLSVEEFEFHEPGSPAFNRNMVYIGHLIQKAGDDRETALIALELLFTDRRWSYRDHLVDGPGTLFKVWPAPVAVARKRIATLREQQAKEAELVQMVQDRLEL